MYNPPDTVENNLITGIGHYVPDDLDEVQTMRFQVISVLTARPHHVSSHFWNISIGVKRWTRPLTDIQDVGDRILQQGIHTGS